METVTHLALILLCIATFAPAVKGFWNFGKKNCDGRECEDSRLPGGKQCYTKRKMFVFISRYPDCPDVSDVKFYLFTRNVNLMQEIRANDNSIETSDFDHNKPTKFVIHGFTGTGTSKWPLDIKNAILEIEDANVITVDWEKGAKGPSYFQAVANTITTAHMTAELIRVMVKNHGSNSNEVHLIGHSLGAHVSGIAGKKVKELLDGQLVGRISGLDPAGLYFENYGDENRLKETDAAFVDVIHTTWKILGTTLNSGHVDFYVNKNEAQPGCDNINIDDIVNITDLTGKIGCSHGRSVEIFIYSISKCSHPANQCTMGYYANTNDCSGVVDLRTTRSPPYCKE